MYVIAEGTYTSLLNNADIRVFIDRNYNDTRAHRVKRVRDESELDEFVERVLKIEHQIISSHKARADYIIKRDYDVQSVNKSIS
jgi:uridine kinase